ncbi:MAG: hypothetical protein Q9215_007727, partial [Flavoplaca cf. flavocitrina]
TARRGPTPRQPPSLVFFGAGAGVGAGAGAGGGDAGFGAGGGGLFGGAEGGYFSSSNEQANPASHPPSTESKTFVFVLGDELRVDGVCYGDRYGVVGELVIGELTMDFDGGNIDCWAIDVAVHFDGWDIDVFDWCAGVWDVEVSSAEVSSTTAEVSAKISPSTVISTPASAATTKHLAITGRGCSLASFVLDFQPRNQDLVGFVCMKRKT